MSTSISDHVPDQIGDFDDVLESVNPFGKYQKLILALVFLPAVIPGSFHGFNQVFLAVKPKDYWCHVPELSRDMPNITDRQSFLPLHPLHRDANRCLVQENEQKKTHSHCSMFNATMDLLTGNPRNVSFALLRASVPEVPCQNGYEYDRSVFRESIVTEWNLICDKQHYPTIALIALMLGAAIGTIVFGFVADRWGRKRAYFFCICTQLFAGIATAFSHNFSMFCVCRFIVGATYPASWSLPFTLAMEIITPKYRAAFATAASISYNVGALIVIGIAYWIQNWREFALATCVPLCYVFIYQCFMPESPRWLLTRKRIPEVQAFFFKVARCNGTKFEPALMEKLLRHDKDWDNTTKAKNYSYIDLFRSPNLRKKTILLSFINCANLCVYLGLSYHSPTLLEDPFVSFSIASAIEIPAYLFVYLVADRIGRRLPMVGCLIIGGCLCITTAFIQCDTMGLFALVIIGKLCISASFTFGEIYEQELFPTVVRSQGASLTQNISNAVACVFPLINYLGVNNESHPVIIFGAFSLIAGISALFLPETLGTDLPQTLKDGEEFGRNMKWRDVIRLVPSCPSKANLPIPALNNQRNCFLLECPSHSSPGPTAATSLIAETVLS